jgi:hypothetical protein
MDTSAGRSGPGTPVSLRRSGSALRTSSALRASTTHMPRGCAALLRTSRLRLPPGLTAAARSATGSIRSGAVVLLRRGRVQTVLLLQRGRAFYARQLERRRRQAALLEAQQEQEQEQEYSQAQDQHQTAAVLLTRGLDLGSPAGEQDSARGLCYPSDPGSLWFRWRGPCHSLSMPHHMHAVRKWILTPRPPPTPRPLLAHQGARLASGFVLQPRRAAFHRRRPPRQWPRDLAHPPRRARGAVAAVRPAQRPVAAAGGRGRRRAARERDERRLIYGRGRTG